MVFYYFSLICALTRHYNTNNILLNCYLFYLQIIDYIKSSLFVQVNMTCNMVKIYLRKSKIL